MDKYWITFSQWHKSSAAAAFETACGVVRHFKGSCVAPFEGMVNRGIQRALSERPACVRSLPLFLSWSSSIPPRLSLPDRNETACLHLRPCPSLFHLSPQPQLSNRPYLQTSLSLPPSLTVFFYCCFNSLRVTQASDCCNLVGQSGSSYHCWSI